VGEQGLLAVADVGDPTTKVAGVGVPGDQVKGDLPPAPADEEGIRRWTGIGSLRTSRAA
jgi:hypothetical protein